MKFRTFFAIAALVAVSLVISNPHCSADRNAPDDQATPAAVHVLADDQAATAAEMPVELNAPVYLAAKITTPEPGIFRFVQDEPGGEPGGDNPPISVIGWIGIVAGGLVIQLGFVQYVLKRIPTPRSVKIRGIIGQILDVLTLFQNDETND